MVVMTGKPLFHPIIRSFFLGNLPTKIRDGGKNGDLQILAIHGNRNATPTGYAIISIKGFPAETVIAIGRE